MQNAKGGWAKVGVLTALMSCCLGVIYALIDPIAYDAKGKPIHCLDATPIVLLLLSCIYFIVITYVCRQRSRK
jgi:hypothetical protein